MIYAPAQQIELRYRPSYREVADAAIRRCYELTEEQLITSREGSDYVRRRIALAEVDRRLQQLAAMNVNWDSYGTEQPTQTAVSNAASIAKTFIEAGLIPDAITASSEGGIAICYIRDQRYADIECFNSGEVLAVRYNATQDPQAWVIHANTVANDGTVQIFSQHLSA